MFDLTYQRVRVMEPSLFYPRVDRFSNLHGDPARGFPPMCGTVVKCSPRSVLVRAEYVLRGESCRRFAWVPRENVAVLTF